MKKAIAALLASFVGLFGYQIVDKALESRVDNLEYQVSSQQELIESYHSKENTESSSTSEKSSTTQPLQSGKMFEVGEKQQYTGQAKFLVRTYLHEAPRVIANTNKEQVSATKIPSDSSAQYYSGPFYYIDDYFMFISDAYRICEDITQITEKCFNEDYTIVDRVVAEGYTLHYRIEGTIDPYFAGRTISNNNNGQSIINEDGSFIIDYVVDEGPVGDTFNLNLRISYS